MWIELNCTRARREFFYCSVLSHTIIEKIPYDIYIYIYIYWSGNEGQEREDKWNKPEIVRTLNIKWRPPSPDSWPLYLRASKSKYFGPETFIDTNGSPGHGLQNPFRAKYRTQIFSAPEKKSSEGSWCIVSPNVESLLPDIWKMSAAIWNVWPVHSDFNATLK